MRREHSFCGPIGAFEAVRSAEPANGPLYPRDDLRFRRRDARMAQLPRVVGLSSLSRVDYGASSPWRLSGDSTHDPGSLEVLTNGWSKPAGDAVCFRFRKFQIAGIWISNARTPLLLVCPDLCGASLRRELGGGKAPEESCGILRAKAQLVQLFDPQNLD